MRLNTSLPTPTPIFSRPSFKDINGTVSAEKKAQAFREHIASLDVAGKADAYVKIMSIPPVELINQFISSALEA